jgi:hypothetical protein
VRWLLVTLNLVFIITITTIVTEFDFLLFTSDI